MRVLIVTPWFPSFGHPGAGIFNFRDATLIAGDHEVRVLHLIRPDWFLAEDSVRVEHGLSVRRVPFSAQNLFTWSRARDAIREELLNTDLLHTMAFPSLIAFSGLRVNVPWVHTEHWSGINRGSKGVLAIVGRCLRALLALPDEVVAVSQPLASSVAGSTRREPEVIGNAVPLPEPGLVSHLPRENEPLRIVAIGGLVPHKGPFIAVDVVAALNEQGVRAELSWIGEGPLRNSLISHAVEHGIGDSVHLTGQLDRRQVEQALLSAHAFILPTESETFGIAIGEALGCGLPVVATGIGGHVDMLRKFESTRLVTRTAPAIAEALLELLQNDSDEARQSAAAVARSMFSESSRATAYKKVYESAINSRS